MREERCRRWVSRRELDELLRYSRMEERAGGRRGYGDMKGKEERWSGLDSAECRELRSTQRWGYE